MMGVLDAARTRFAARPRNRMAMPEWTPDGEPVMEVFFKTPNAITLSEIEEASKGNQFEQTARLVVACAEDQEGQKLFAPGDHKDLLIFTDPVALGRLGRAIMAGASIDAEQAAKN